MRMGGIVMYFEIIETYPAELFDSTLSFLKIPVQMGTDKLKYEECVKLILKNDSQVTESYNIIEAFLNFCETTLQLKHNDLDTSSLKLDLNTLEENAFVKTNFRAIPQIAYITVDKENPNEMKIIFSHSSSSIIDVSFKLKVSTFYFIFSSLINIRNYIDYSSLSLNSRLKTQIMRLKIRIDMLFDELITNDILKGFYECRLTRATDSRKQEESQTVLSAIKSSSKYYGARSYSVFTVNDYTFMLIEHDEFSEVSLFEYKIKSKVYNIDL